MNSKRKAKIEKKSTLPISDVDERIESFNGAPVADDLLQNDVTYWLSDQLKAKLRIIHPQGRATNIDVPINLLELAPIDEADEIPVAADVYNEDFDEDADRFISFADMVRIVDSASEFKQEHSR